MNDGLSIYKEDNQPCSFCAKVWYFYQNIDGVKTWYCKDHLPLIDREAISAGDLIIGSIRAYTPPQPQSRADARAAEKFAREQAMKIGTPLWLSFTTTALGSFLAGAIVASLMRL